MRSRGRPPYEGAFTPRQQDVVELLVTGLTNDEIAQQLGISPDGVKYHVSEILRRLGVENRHEVRSHHLRSGDSGRLAAWAPVMFLRKLPFAWLSKAAAGAVLAATAVGIALLAWGVMSTSSVAVTTTGCSAEQTVGSEPQCAPGVAQADAGAGAITAISTGFANSCALRDGGVWCWGGYFDSDGVTPGSPVPMVVPGLTSGVSAISSGIHSCALQHGGVSCWGAYVAADGTLTAGAPVAVSGLTSGVSAISTGPLVRSCALKDGGVWCWEQITYGGPSTGVRFSPPEAVPGLASGVSAISAGGNYSCALKGSGAWCWGANNDGELGNNSTTDSDVAVAVSGLASGVTALSAGVGPCAVKDGGVWCWGRNFAGELGNDSQIDSPVPVPVSGLASGVSAISSTRSNTCALKDGGVWCWGRMGPAETESHVPVAVSGLASGVSAISAGDDHACALKDDGVWCWGGNDAGQLGNNSTTDSPVPVAVRFPPPSAGDTAAVPDAKPPPSQPSADSDDHRTTYVLAGTAAAALAIVAAGGWAVRRRRRIG